MPYDPLSPPRFTRAQCSAYFGGKADSRLAAELYKSDPVKYKELRAAAVIHGLLGLPSYATAEEISQLPMNRGAKVFSDEQLRAMSEFSPAACKDWYTRSGSDGNTENVDSLSRTDPAKAARLRTAAIAHGIVPDRPSRPVRSLQPDKPHTFVLGETLRKHFSFPEGHEVTSDEFLRLSRIKSEQDAAAEAAA